MTPRFHHLLTAALGASLACAQETPPKPATPPNPPEPPAVAPGEPAPNRERPARDRGGRPGPQEDRPEGERNFQPRDEPPDFVPPGRPDGERPRRGDGEGFQPRGEFAPDGGPRREGQFVPRGEGQFVPREGQFMRRPPERLQPYLGVITRPTMPEISAQLRQPEGFGLIVDDLLPESPAATAGLLRNDLLLRFEDQLLVNPPQLEALVRRAGKDHEVALTILRAGEEKKITIKIGEKLLPERRPLAGMERFPANFERDFPRGEDGDQRPRPVRESGPGDGDNGGVIRGGGNGNGGNREIRYLPERARIVRQDAQGIYELNLTNGQPTLIIKSPDGTITWQGPVKTPDQRQAVPKEYQEKLTALEDARSGPPGPPGPRVFRAQDGQPGQPREGQPRNAQPRAGQGWAPGPGATDPIPR